jgi:hypothetical protein
MRIGAGGVMVDTGVATDSEGRHPDRRRRRIRGSVVSIAILETPAITATIRMATRHEHAQGQDCDSAQDDQHKFHHRLLRIARR